MITPKIDPQTDLVLDRTVDVPRELVWRAWTEPKHLMPWFCPLPWKTVDCAIDLRPGGAFMTHMQGPNGESMKDTGCYLEVVPHERLTWTGALGPDFRPKAGVELAFTAVLTFEKTARGTRYLVQALHPNAAQKVAHEKMGFAEGWGAALDQLVKYVKAL